MYNGNSIWNRLECRVIHNLIGQINSNQGRFDRKSINLLNVTNFLLIMALSSYFPLLSVQRPFKYLLGALAVFRNQMKLIFILSCRNLINPFFLNIFLSRVSTGIERPSKVSV